MAQGVRIITFNISGKIYPQSEEKPQYLVKQGDTMAVAEEDIFVKTLIYKSEIINENIQNQVEELNLITDVNTISDIHFRKGNSIIIYGTILIIGFVGQVALDAIRTELAEILRVSVRRALRRTELGGYTGIAAPVDVTVEDNNPRRRANVAPTQVTQGQEATAENVVPGIRLTPVVILGFVLSWLLILTVTIVVLLATSPATGSQGEGTNPRHSMIGAGVF